MSNKRRRSARRKRNKANRKRAGLPEGAVDVRKQIGGNVDPAIVNATTADPAIVSGMDDGDPFAEFGITGLEVYSGRIFEEFLPQLSTPRKRVQVFTEMKDNDATVGAVLFAVEMLIRQVDWRIDPASEDERDVAAAEFVDECLSDMQETWDDTLAGILSFLPFGFHIAEEVYKERRGSQADPPSQFDDGLIGWRKLAPRGQETIEEWNFNDHLEVNAVVQLGPPDWTRRTIPASRFLLFRTQAHKSNPEGRSVLRSAYVPWFRKKGIERIEAIGIERDLAGLPTAKVPPRLLSKDASPSDKQVLAEIKTILSNIRRDEREGVVFPLAYDDNGNLTYELSLLSTGGRRQFDTSQIVTRYDRRIAQTVLADFILLGQEAVGSFALADSKTELFAVAIGAWLEAIAEVMNRRAIPRLFELNPTLVTGNGLPVLVPGDIEAIDLATLGEYITKLSGAGMPLFPDVELERDLRQRAGIPDVPEDRVAMEQAGLVPLAGSGGGPAVPGTEPGTPDDDAGGVPAGELGVRDGVSGTVLTAPQIEALADLASKVASKDMAEEAAMAVLALAFGVTDEALARKLLTPPPEKTDAERAKEPIPPGMPGGPPQFGGGAPEPDPADDDPEADDDDPEADDA